MQRQASVACQSCGSWYRNGDNCNRCGAYTEEPATEELRMRPKSWVGKKWSKKQHRYLTQSEIAAGHKGG